MLVKTGYRIGRVGFSDRDGFYSYPVLVAMNWRIRGNKNKECCKLFKPNYSYNHFVIYV